MNVLINEYGCIFASFIQPKNILAPLSEKCTSRVWKECLCITLWVIFIYLLNISAMVCMYKLGPNKCKNASMGDIVCISFL